MDSKAQSAWALCAFAALCGGVSRAAINIVPRPWSLQAGSGTLQVPASVVIAADSSSRLAASWLDKLFSQAGIASNSGPAASAQVTVALDHGLDSLGSEGYRLTISSNGIAIAAPAPAGQFYAVQTLRQLLPPQIERSGAALPKALALPAMTILDKPRHAWRGVMFDPARRFLPLSYLRQTLDRMALYKLNRLHLHLSDDQGWRLEIKSWPRLAKYGGGTQVGGGPGGFYTQSEMADLIHYAADRHIVIVPEFDMPGHTQAAIAAYPKLACAGADTSLNTGVKVGFSTLCVGQPAVAGFLDDVMREVAALFPGPYIHIGGDETKVTAPADYTAFIRQAEAAIKARGKAMIGWDDIGASKQEASTLTQAWHNVAGSIDSHSSELYLDHANLAGDTSVHGGSAVSFQKVYGAAAGALGMEGPVWGEYVQNVALADRQLFPRALALAEAAWAPANDNFAEFKTRVADQGIRLDAMGIQWYAADTAIAWKRGTAYPSYASAFDGFTPAANPVAVLIGARRPAAPRAPHPAFDPLGRRLRPSGAGFGHSGGNLVEILPAK